MADGPRKIGDHLGQEGGMSVPVQISKAPLLGIEEREMLDKAKHARRMQWVFMGLVATVLLTFAVPLCVLLTRLALGM